MENPIEQYFVNPIFDRTGYNAVNTLTYAAIALLSLYIVWRLLKANNFNFAGREFLYGTAAFVLLGSTSRVLTDLSDAGAIKAAAMQGGSLGQLYAALDSSDLFHYGYLTVSPGIYIVTALLFLLSIGAGMKMKKPMFPAYAGIALWLPCLLLMLPFMVNFAYLLLAVALAGIASFAAFSALRKFGKIELGLHHKLAIAGQSLDGAATYVVIDIFGKLSGKGYFEQHVLSAGIGESTPLGFGLFFAVKVALAAAIVYLVGKEDMGEKDRALVLIVVAIMGFAPGMRDLLRMLCGT